MHYSNKHGRLLVCYQPLNCQYSWYLVGCVLGLVLPACTWQVALEMCAAGPRLKLIAS
jgi:hypothetical protein